MNHPKKDEETSTVGFTEKTKLKLPIGWFVSIMVSIVSAALWCQATLWTLRAQIQRDHEEYMSLHQQAWLIRDEVEAEHYRPTNCAVNVSEVLRVSRPPEMMPNGRGWLVPDKP